MNVTDSDNFNRHLSSYKEGFNPDPEQGLARLYQRLDTAPVVKTATVRSLGQRKWLGIAASLLVLIVAGFLLLREEGATILTNPSPTPMAVELPDGTDVLLQEGASLRYADDYNANDRRVDLDGQAYFQVHKDATRPFLVSTDSTHLRVTGTAFNLRINDQELEVEVAEGSVELKHQGETIPVSAKQCGLAVVGRKCAIMPAEHLNRHAWRTGTLRFDSVPLPLALKTISNNYGYNLSYPADCDFPLEGNYAADDPIAVLQTIAKLDGGNLEQVDDVSFRFVNMKCAN